MREDARRRVLRSLPGKHREHLERLLRFREQTAGALMESRLLTLMPDETAAEAIGRVRADASRVARHLYVVDRPGRLAGVVSLKELLAAADDTAVAQVMTPDGGRSRGERRHGAGRPGSRRPGRAVPSGHLGAGGQRHRSHARETRRRFAREGRTVSMADGATQALVQEFFGTHPAEAARRPTCGSAGSTCR